MSVPSYWRPDVPILQTYTRVELTEEGIRSGKCKQRVGTVTGYDLYGGMTVLPDGRKCAQRYPPSYWRPIGAAELRRGARLPKLGDRR